MSDWPKETKYLGKGAPRIDGPAKVTGAAKYAYDVQPSGWLWGAILRSKWAAAKITSINLDKAKAAPGIKAALLAREGRLGVLGIPVMTVGHHDRVVDGRATIIQGHAPPTVPLGLHGGDLGAKADAGA